MKQYDLIDIKILWLSMNNEQWSLVSIAKVRTWTIKVTNIFKGGILYSGALLPRYQRWEIETKSKFYHCRLQSGKRLSWCVLFLFFLAGPLWERGNQLSETLMHRVTSQVRNQKSKWINNKFSLIVVFSLNWHVLKDQFLVWVDPLNFYFQQGVWNQFSEVRYLDAKQSERWEI